MTIECRNIETYSQEGARLLGPLSLSFASSGFTIITGANGSGKTVLLRHLFGLMNPDKGDILFEGKKLSKNLELARKKMALVFQEPVQQILGLTVREDLYFSIDAKAPNKSDLALERAKNVGLDNKIDSLVATLSGGQKRRLAIASALAQQSELIFLDEPFNDLDWQGASDLIEVLLTLQAQGIGIVVVTHDLEKCLAHADRLIVLKEGQLAADDRPAVLFESLTDFGLRGGTPYFDKLSKLTWYKGNS